MSSEVTPNVPYATLPAGWYCVAISSCGYGVYVKRVRNDGVSAGSRGFGFTAGRVTVYRVIFNGFMGGWIVDVDRREGNYMLGGQHFTDPLAAMLAVEVELTNGNSV
ncbi:hypothetical protein D3C81_895200 [compost metagenome]